jgi:hypothetical protein
MPAVIPPLEMQGMLSRALSLATVTILIGCFTAGVARAQNLDAGKSPSQIFSSTCSACHKSPRGLLKTTPASSLPGFLRQHYTTGSDMASMLASYLISNGAADPRYQGKDKRDARQDRRQQEGRPEQPERLGRRQPAQESERPDAEVRPQGEGARPGREGRRYGRSRAAPEAAQPTDRQAPLEAATDSKPVGRQKQGRRHRSAPQEAPRTEQTVPGDAAKSGDVSPDASKSESAATDSGRPVSTRPDTDSAKSESHKTDGYTIDGERPGGDQAKSAGERSRESSDSHPLQSDPAPPASAATDSAASPPTTTSSTSPPVAAPVVPAGPPVPPISR